MMENKKNESIIYSEIDYLWDAMGEAQQQANSASDNFKENSKEIDLLNSRIHHLDNLIRKKDDKAISLKDNIAALNTQIDENSALMKDAESLISRFDAAQEKIISLTSKLAKEDKRGKLSNMVLSELRAEIKAANATLQEKQDLIKEFEHKVQGLLALPAISNLVKKNSKPGKENLLETLSANLIKAKLEKKLLSQETEKVQGIVTTLRENIKELSLKNLLSEKELRAMSAQLRTRFSELEEKTKKLNTTENLKSELSESFNALKNEYENFKRDMNGISDEKKSLDKKLREKEEETLDLKLKLKDTDIKIEEEKNNFSDAVKKVFHLQSKLNIMKETLNESTQVNKELQVVLGQKKLDLEKINARLRDSSLNAGQEHEMNTRFQNKIQLLKTEIQDLKEKSVKETSYSKNLFEQLNNKQNTVEFLKKQLNKMDALELEIEDVKRKNIKMNSMIKEEQTNFTDKMIKSLVKLHSDLKIVNIKLPLMTRKLIASPIKGLLTNINLLKAWEEYVDESPVVKEYSSLRDIIDPMLEQWNKTFRLKRMKLQKRITTDGRCLINKEKIKFAFYQVIKNSYEAMSAGCALSVTLSMGTDKKSAILKFEDTAKGIDHEVFEKLYQPFNTTKDDHMGIGLIITKKITESHGGTLSITHGKTKGTIVQFKFPLAIDENIPKLQKEEEEKGETKKEG
jgi:signal transduction histidine kinase